ncbi:clathrin adaptor, mu subunit [Meredithblackwellia eburnea MCA 4105]
MCSIIALVDQKGKSLIQRAYRDDIDTSTIEKFLPLVMDAEEEGSYVNPCFTNEGITFIHMKHNNVYMVALTRRNANAAELLAFLHKFIEVLREYFRELEEESIRDNFVIIYELLDEMMDFGYPQSTEAKILKEYITQESYKLEPSKSLVRPPNTLTNAVSWRSEGITYKKNEVFLDVIESVNLMVNANGNVLRSEIHGEIKMRVYLSGMPELRLGLNDKVMLEAQGKSTRKKVVEMEDVRFHQSVRLTRFENDRTVSFIPPDGEFQLMSYRIYAEVKPLIWAEALVQEHSGTRLEYVVKIKSQYKKRSTANGVEIVVPVSDDVSNPKFKAPVGTVKYWPEKSAFIWTLRALPGGKEYVMRADFSLPTIRGEAQEKRIPITVKFEIPYFTVSGIQVRYLKVSEKSGYKALPWVRYITQSGEDYSLRTNQGSRTAHDSVRF